MKKVFVLLLVLVMALSVFAGCSNNENTNAKNNETNNVVNNAGNNGNESADPDAVTTASIVTDGNAFAKGLSKDGTWIVAALNDITLTEDLVVEGEFTNKDAVIRKLALYTQDEERNVTARFTLTVPKMIVKSENTRVQSGIVKGDIYVENNGFNLVDATVEGNIYFATKEALDTFTIDDRSKVTGTLKLDGVDVVTTASLVVTGDDLVKGLSADGTWIVAVYHNMSLKQEIIVNGEFIHRDAIARKLALYTQDEERNITASFTVAAPKMTVKSENFSIQGGTFKGDVYVEANGFSLLKTSAVDGNIYFAKQEYKDSFVLEEGSSVTGTMEVQ
ncbi:MAG: hypothetical protein JXR88_08100 [Clostridia bacterium]|nr:hypothetical protein [Clostridia bacterium]